MFGWGGGGSASGSEGLSGKSNDYGSREGVTGKDSMRSGGTTSGAGSSNYGRSDTPSSGRPSGSGLGGGSGGGSGYGGSSGSSNYGRSDTPSSGRPGGGGFGGGMQTVGRDNMGRNDTPSSGRTGLGGDSGRPGGGSVAGVGDVGGMARDIRSGSNTNTPTGLRPGDVGAMARVGIDSANRNLETSRAYDQNRRTGFASAFRASETASMGDMAAFKDSYKNALIGAIVGPESAGKYNVMYGGDTFDDYSDHPRVAHTIRSGPNKGKKSTAAGIGQFLSGTWDSIASELGLTDFSPESQRAAVWGLAERDYKKATGRSLENDLASATAAGDENAIGKIGKALSGTWTSLPGGIEQQLSEKQFARAFMGNIENIGYQSAQAGATPRTANAIPKGDTANDFATKFLGGAGSRENNFLRNCGIEPNSAYNDENTREIIDGTRDIPKSNPRTGVFGNAPEGPKPGQQYPDRPRSLGEQIAAGILDAGSSMIPGVGQYLGIANAGLALTGNRTIGERIVDAIMTGEGGEFRGGEGDPWRDPHGEITGRFDGSRQQEGEAKNTADEFIANYLEPDQTKRPTPYDKYVAGRDSYTG